MRIAKLTISIILLLTLTFSNTVQPKENILFQHDLKKAAQFNQEIDLVQSSNSQGILAEKYFLNAPKSRNSVQATNSRNSFEDCEDGYVSDCVDADCCPEIWIGDGLCDGEDQQWGCDLTCYEDDGGDCAPPCDEELLTCWDLSCVTDLSECPEQNCDAAPSQIWLGDGYCDSSNNLTGCWDMGDCCESTCVDSNYDCGIVGYDCLDPEAIENDPNGTCGDGWCQLDEDCDCEDCFDTFGCLYPDCYADYPQYVGNGACDTEFYGINIEECGFDGGDCCVSTNPANDEFCGGFSGPACDCQDPSACENQSPVENDGCCSDGEDCSNADCSENLDCLYPDCVSTYLGSLGNGNCDSEYYALNNDACGFDGGDCCVETAGDPPGSQGDCSNGNYGNGEYCDCMDPEYANFGPGDTCEEPIEATVGSNSSDGHDEYFIFSTSDAGFLTISTAGAGIDTKFFVYNSCDDVDIINFPYGEYVAYNDDWGSSLYGICPDCSYWAESYIFVEIPAGDYIIVSSDQYNSAFVPFDWSLDFEVGVEGCTDPIAENFDNAANIDDGSCEYIMGCTDTMADNFDPGATMDDGSCDYSIDPHHIVCDGGNWQYEVLWILTDHENNTILEGSAPYDDYVFLNPGSYILYSFDSYGDGWNGNIWSITDIEDNLVFEYTLIEGTEGPPVAFTIESDCMLGDVTMDESLNVLDIVMMVSAIIDNQTDTMMPCGDFNEDGSINVLDVVAIVNLILEQ